MSGETLKPDAELGPRERAKLVTFAPHAASDWRGRVGMLVARYVDAPASDDEEINPQMIQMDTDEDQDGMRRDPISHALPSVSICVICG